MPTTKRTFHNGKMNLDIDERFLPVGEYAQATNIRVSNSESSDVGAIEKSLSNKQLTTLDLGENVYTLASLRDEFEEKIYWAVLSNLGCYIIEHDVNEPDPNLNTTFVLKDTRVVGVDNVLGFKPEKRLQMALIVDSDNDNRLLAFTDNNTQPKLINVERAKGYGINGFNEEMILLIKKPPLFAPTIALGNTPNVENNLEEKFILFAYRYKYLDGEYSALSPYSDVAFGADVFSYDYLEGVNNSMVNVYNSVNIGLNTGSNLVTDIEIVYKEAAKNTIYLIETFNKADKGWADNDILDPLDPSAFTFTNSKIYKALPEKELYRLFDNVPLLAKALAIINNRIVFGNYTENYNIADCEGTRIPINFTVDKVEVTEPILNNIGTESVKSNRDYEIGIAYIDDYGRMTTPLTSENNTIHVPLSDSINKTQLKVNIVNQAPCFAKYYRLFVKQNKTHYNNIIPSLFYEDDQYRWIKLDQSDKDKIKEGDYIIVKSDSQSVITTLTKTKVLEISKKEKNFLQPDNEISDIINKANWYFKINPKNFEINTEDYYNYYLKSFSYTSNTRVAITQPDNVVYDPEFYGTTLDDMKIGASTASTTNNTFGDRYIVKIASSGTPDTFEWSSDNGKNFSAPQIITGAGDEHLLDKGIYITFDNTTGHFTTDEWNFYVSTGYTSDEYVNFGFFRTVGDFGELRGTAYTIDDETIESAANIDLINTEYSIAGQARINLPLVSNGRYKNIMEWYFRENIEQQIKDNLEYSLNDGYTVDVENIEVGFIRCKLEKIGDWGTSAATYNADGFMTMYIKNQLSYNYGYLSYSISETTVFQQGESPIVFETNAKDVDNDIFFEIGQTYPITNGYHMGNGLPDVDQTDLANAEIVLPFHNCYAWGNAVESYKIKDSLIGNQYLIDTRPTTTIENYRRNKRIASYTWSNVYEQTSNYNAINEFNLALENFNDIDDKYGSIQAMVSWDNDLDVWQEDKVLKVLYDKSVLYNKDGSGDLVASDDILKNTIPYSGEYGISENPESLVVYGNYTYWADAKRGVFLRKGQSGIEIISNFGVKDWTRDNMIALSTFIIGGYDPYFGQFVMSLNGKTLTFSENIKGWTSFHSWIPDEMVRINNRFFTIKDGQLYLHNDNTNPEYNTFYGVTYPSDITTVINDSPSEDKIFKNLIEEGTSPWKATITTNLATGTIEASEFNQRESKWFAHTRKNEDTSDLTDIAQGIGNIVSVSNNLITFAKLPTLISVGENLMQLNEGTPQEIGDITDIQGTVITVGTIVNTPVAGQFAYSVKNARVQGSEIRGYYAKVKLENDDTGNSELFALNSNLARSFAPTDYK